MMPDSSDLARFLLVALLWPAAAWAQGGPPLVTDDPDTPGPAHWEVNLAMMLERDALEHRVELPQVDVNYGVGRRVQLKFEAPWVLVRDEVNERREGVGIAGAGVKWRFIGQEGKRVAWSVYPQFEFNPVPSSVEENRAFLLPTEVTVEFAHAEINGEIGRRFVTGRSDSLIFGVSSEGHVAPRLELVGELHGEQSTGEQTTVLANFGARPKLTRHTLLLLAAGRSVHGPVERGTHLYLYLGLQLNLPDQYSFKDPAGSLTPAR